MSNVLSDSSEMTFSNINNHHRGFYLQTSKVSRLLWYSQIKLNMIDLDLVSWSFCFYYIPQFTLGLVLLSSDWSDCQDLASDWSILEVGKYLRYLWLFTSSVCYKTIEQSSNKINKTRHFCFVSDTTQIQKHKIWPRKMNQFCKEFRLRCLTVLLMKLKKTKYTAQLYFGVSFV